MRFSNKISPDLLAVGISACIITVCSALLYADYSVRGGAGEEKQIGTITYKKKTAQRKYASQVVWEDLEQNAPVYNNDTVRTADLSEAIIHLGDGTSINIDENSLILLATSGTGINIDFSHGSISANREAGAGGGGQVTIQSKEATVSLEKGDVKLSKTAEQKEINVTVTEGTADIKAGAVEKTITKDEKAVITEDRKAKVVKLNLKLAAPAPNENFVTTAAAMPVNFAWEKAEGVDVVYLEIARDGGFTRGVTARPAAGMALAELLAEGSYYWRIRALNKTTGAPEYSDVRKVSVIRDLPLRLIYPRNNETITYSVKPPIINLRWEENRLASEYIVEISRDSAFGSIERSVATPLREISVDRLGAGSYYWRVRTRNAGVAAYSATSAAFSFRINRLAELAPPALIAPADGRRLSASMLGRGRSFMFSWSADSQAREYEIAIARDDGFRDVALRARSGDNWYALSEGLAPGRYFWRVGAAPGGEGKTAYSATSGFTVVAAGTVRPGAPRVTSVKGNEKEGARVTVRFPWTVTDFRGTCLFELSRDREFLDVAGTRSTRGDSVDMEDLGPGVYYWRVRLIDDDRSQIAESIPLPLFVGTRGGLVGSAQEINQGKSAAELAREEAEIRKIRDEEARRQREELARQQQEERERKKQEELEHQKQLEIEKKQREEELAQKQQEELAHKQQEELARKQQQELARKQQEELARKQQQELARKQQEELARKQQGELARKQQQELARKQQEELARKQQGELARKQQEELARKQQQELARKQQQELARKQQQELARKQQQELARKQQEELARKQQGELARKQQEELARKQQQELARKQQQELARKQQEELARKQQQELARKQQDLARKQQETARGPVYKEKYPGRRTRWRTNLASTVMSRPVCKNNIIVATTKNGILAGLNLNGSQRWHTALGSPVRATPAADDIAVYAVTVNGFLCAVNINNGALKWKKKVEGPMLFGAEPIAENNHVYIATSYGVVQAFDQEGKETWKRDLEEGIFSSITFDNGLLYVGTDRSKVYALNAKDGSVRWSCGTDSRIFTSSPKVYRGLLFVGCYSGSFYAIDARSGWLRWSFKAAHPVLSSPAFSGNSVFFGSEDGVVYALGTADGRKLWEFRTTGSIVAGPEVSGNSLLIPSSNAVWALDVASGDLNWKEGLDATINTPVTVVGTAAFVGLDNGELVSFGTL